MTHNDLGSVAAMIAEAFPAAVIMKPNEDVGRILFASLEKLPVGLVVIDSNGVVLFVNRVAGDMLGCASNCREDISWSELCEGRELRSFDDAYAEEESDPLILSLQQNQCVTRRVQIVTLGMGRERWISMSAAPVSGEGKGPIASVASLFDITDLKGIQDVLYHQATHDPLTGLSNRMLFLSSLDNALARVRRDKSGGAILALDLDNFKRVNDTLGHAAGDELLIKVASRLHKEVRETDLVARFGGDEFSVLLQDMEERNKVPTVKQVAQRLCETVECPFTVSGREVRITASLGVCLFPENGSDEDTLLSRADTAMYQVKEQSRNGWKFWSEPAEEVKP